MAQPILSLQELSKYYVNGRNVVAGLNKVSVAFETGEFVAITGESGSGKSTLAHIMGGILPYEDGELFIGGKPTSHYDSADWERYRAESVGFISQSYGILPGATVLENVVSALHLTGMEKDEAAVEAQKILEEVELWDLRARRAAKLSSGQKQRLSIARALAKPCRILIADEPTGNLDPENSDKVIRLLAKAARDRLVILITHEFSEAENYVTRHICIQDGRICADARLRPHAAEEQPPIRRKAGKGLSFYTARLQVKSRPVWSTIVLLFLTLTAFAVFAFLGSFIVALDDTSTRIYESDAFLNSDKERIIAVRKDLANMTQADYDTILDISHVESLDQYGYITDICYAYIEDVDYVIHYTRTNIGSFRRPQYIETTTVEFLATEQFMQTLPVTKNGRSILTAGREPERFDEIVAVGGEELIGKTYTIHLSNTTAWGSDGYITMDFTVVGVTGEGSGLYFSADAARAITMNYLGSEYTYIPIYDQVYNEYTYTNYRNARSVQMYGPFCDPFYATCDPVKSSGLRELSDTEAWVTLKDYITLLSANPTAEYADLYEGGITTQSGFYHVGGIMETTLPGVLGVTPAVFQAVLEESGVEDGNQVSITISDYAYTQRVIDDLEKAGYFALSPYVLGSAKIDPELAAQRMQTLYVCIGALIAVLLLQLIVLRTLFAMENQSYATLSDLGLTCRTAQLSVFWQVLLFTVAGQIIALGAIAICGGAGVERITALTRYLYGKWWVLISLIHLASTALAAWLICVGLKKRVYPRTARVSDLAIDDEEEVLA